jgi:hypothetical protein
MKLLLLLVAFPLRSQPLRLSQAIEQSLQQYPSLKVNRAQVVPSAAPALLPAALPLASGSSASQTASAIAANQLEQAHQAVQIATAVAA